MIMIVGCLMELLSSAAEGAGSTLICLEVELVGLVLGLEEGVRQHIQHVALRRVLGQVTCPLIVFLDVHLVFLALYYLFGFL